MCRRVDILGALVLALLLRAEVARGQTSVDVTPQQGVLLLGNGAVIEGRITRAGDQFFVTLPEGEIRVRAIDVERCCATLDEGYQSKHDSLRGDDVAEMLNLAQWCVTNHLYGYAAREIADAYRLEPRNPLITIVERKLAAAIAKPTAAAEAPSGPRGPTSEELSAMAASLPPRSIETFTRTIQPLVQNHCATGGCHNVGTHDTFAWERTPQGRPPSRGFTLRNLHTLMELVDRARPSESPLLTMSLTAHGGAARAVFASPDSAPYGELAGWVRGVAGPDTSAVAEPSPQPTSLMPPASATPAAKLLSQQIAPPATSASLPQGKTPASAVQKASHEAPPAVDPFDPEEFNRRHFGDSP